MRSSHGSGRRGTPAYRVDAALTRQAAATIRGRGVLVVESASRQWFLLQEDRPPVALGRSSRAAAERLRQMSL